ncbi:MAG: mutS [Chlamydiales bacterium]|jgi:DNA mismatch repair protein MutS|nr:mutS [Chlamydiales bacterium]
MSEPEREKLSPMMVQWHSCKQSAKSALLLFRMGDFYESFYEDAVLLAKEAELTLTKRQEIPMAGIPYMAADQYIDRLVAKGYRVAIAEQMENPKEAKGLVSREVVRIVSPGTLINSSLVSDKESNYFASLCEVGQVMGLAFLDLTTGDFKVAEFTSLQEALNELHRLAPKELLTAKRFHRKYLSTFKDLTSQSPLLVNQEDDWRFEHDTAYQTLRDHFKVQTLDGFGIGGMCASINAAGALISFLKVNLSLPIEHIRKVQALHTADYLAIDPNAERHLDLIPQASNRQAKTLLFVLDKTKTPMGGRLFRHWLQRPLLNIQQILDRQDSVAAFLAQDSLNLEHSLSAIRDLERLMMKISSGYATLRDINALKLSLIPLPALKESLSSYQSSLLTRLQQEIKDVSSIINLIDSALVEEPPLRIGDGPAFKEGFHPPLDALIAIRKNSREWVNDYQQKLRDETQIKTLKVGYTRAFGYYIEISKGQSEKAPASFQRRQTLVNAERFITYELKTFEEQVLTAEENISAIEQELFRSLLLELTGHRDLIFGIAKAIASIDCLFSLALAAREYHYTRPLIDQSTLLSITEGRHPVIERFPLNEAFISNDTYLDDQSARMMLITGPNMAGKSTYIRQVALIVIMAQIGSFIPAKKGHIGIVDKIFTRIGASDNLARGQSTFMVEMTETAHILHHATDRSLVILDEIGRGTSTYDGISIAWAVAEYLLKEPTKRAKTLFATHYFELTQMEEQIPGVLNFNIAVEDSGDDILFLRKIIRGSADRSFGIHVARLAGVPIEVIHLAQEILTQLELKAGQREGAAKQKRAVKRKSSEEVQLTFFEPAPSKSPAKNHLGDQLIQEIRKIHLNELTPIQALTKLAEWQASFGGPNQGS